MNAVQFLKFLTNLQAVVEIGSAAFLMIQEARARLQPILDERRDPNPEEWEKLFNDIKAHHESIQNS